ncbi:hypothetical protein [Grimontia sp. NTOU-MAR1]|uniref:hypothetical protein n=1 Tax=Grimontia sp. NTOU-MAR1 TaxID=3111011 RepID=UPI002DBA621C|nr:hypothetical protein [Grimontia sp. NTOU-MAR1]WRV97720.1 hypothetical protein VP504_17060 [Grimontia sp. NTOU-MAR1]
MKRIAIITILFLFCSSVSAASYFRARTIIGAGIYYSENRSILMIDISGDKSGMPQCASTRRLAISSTAPHYKEMVTIAMTAYTSQQNNVDIYVSDTCNHWGNAQDILGIKMGTIPW